MSIYNINRYSYSVYILIVDGDIFSFINLVKDFMINYVCGIFDYIYKPYTFGTGAEQIVLDLHD
jgi:hypothetical protein